MAAQRMGKVILALVVSPLLVDCGILSGGPETKAPGKKPAACDLDLKTPEAIMKAEIGLERQLEERVKASLAAAVRLGELGTKVESEVSEACSRLAKDLGASEGDITPKNSGPGKEAEAACTAAAKAVAKVKKKMGADAVLMVETEPPACEVPLDSVVDCVAECDADIKEKDLKVDCVGGKASGKCKGKCEGTCTVKGSGKCDGNCAGSCEGKCDSDIKGTCDGKCEGKCDGKDSKGKCEGTCAGKCSGKVKASCSGKCEGTCSAGCEMSAQADCPGTCTGGCSVEFTEPKCTGTAQLPEGAKPECKASCGAKLNQELECRPAKVTVKITGKADSTASANIKRALEANLPALIKVTVRMQDALGELTKGVKTSLKGVQSAVTEGGAAAKVGGCIVTSLEAQADAAASIDLSIKGSVKVTAAAGGE